MDTSIDSGTSDGDTQGDLPVSLDTLTVDGTNPSVGDPIDLKVSGKVTKIVNKTVWVSPEMVNDQPMPADQTDAPQTDEQFMAAAQRADSGGY